MRLPPALDTARAMPKSATSGCPSCRRMFSGEIAMDYPDAGARSRHSLRHHPIALNHRELFLALVRARSDSPST